MASVMDMVNVLDVMDPITLDHGRMTNGMDKDVMSLEVAQLSTKVTSMLVHTRITSSMVKMEDTNGQMAMSMKAHGKTTKCMEMVVCSLLQALAFDTTAVMRMAMVLEFTFTPL